MKFSKAVILTFLIFFSASCNGKFVSSMFGPSSRNDDGLVLIDSPQSQIPWSPCIGAQPVAAALNTYFQLMQTLKARNMLRTVRIDLILGQYTPSVSQGVRTLGFDVIGIVANENLSDPNPENMIENFISTYYPDVTIFQIGNEVTTSSNMSLEKYMAIFLRIYTYVQTNYPSIILMTQSPSGSGSSGADDLKRMVELGLTPSIISPDKVIVGMNVYTDIALNSYASVRGFVPYRIWVTETGVADQNQHIFHVQSFYPRLAQKLGAERICWYELWAGDSGTDTDFSLIRHPYIFSQTTYSPLYKVLAGVP